MATGKKAVHHVPNGLRTLTPHLNVRGGEKAVEFYKKAFGAEETSRFMMGPGKLGHAELRIGDSAFMLADEFPEMGSKSPQTLGGTGGYLQLYVTDCDAAFDRAVKAGAKPTMPPADMFWGDRFGKVTDPFGHEWGIATHTADLTKEEQQKAGDAFMAEWAKQKK